MGKVLCINDFHLYSEMVSLMLIRKGRHEVKTAIAPFDLEEIRRYRPDLVILNLVRKSASVGQPITDFYTQVDGAKALKALRSTPELARYPLLLTAIALEERELPPGFDYLAYLEVPGKFDYILDTVERIVATHGQHLARE